MGEVKQRWHLWQRNYELFLGKRQFAAINGGLLAWEFTLKDEQDGVLALIDRNFQVLIDSSCIRPGPCLGRAALCSQSSGPC